MTRAAAIEVMRRGKTAGHLKDKIKKAVRSVDSFYYYCVIKKATIAKVDAAKNLWKQVDRTGQSVCFPQYTHRKGILGDNTQKMLEVLE